MDDMNACIKRINELYHLSQERVLTPAEKEEQQFLRKKYVDAIKGNIRNQLNSITVQNPDGSKYSLKEKHDEKMVKVVEFPSKSNRILHGFPNMKMPELSFYIPVLVRKWIQIS